MLNRVRDDLISPKRPCRKYILEMSQIGELTCILCKISDDPQNLCAAGNLHATSKKIKLNHVFFFIEKIKGCHYYWKKMKFYPNLVQEM